MNDADIHGSIKNDKATLLRHPQEKWIKAMRGKRNTTNITNIVWPAIFVIAKLLKQLTQIQIYLQLNLKVQ